MKTKSGSRSWIGPGLLALLLPYVSYQILLLPRRAEIQWDEVLSDAGLTVIVLVAILLLLSRPGLPRTPVWILLGFSALLFSSITDVFDEFVLQPYFVALIFDNLLELLGLAMVVIGLWQWIVFNRQMHDELSELVVTDFLTGAMNRRGFIERFEQELPRAARYKSPLSLIWFDLDHFKEINDRYGHHHGDEVLRRTAQRVFRLTRKVDIFSRMGGEEFCILMPGTSLEGAMEAAEKLRRAFEEGDRDDEFNANASFGVAEYRPGDSVKSLLKRADDAMYQAKKAGRNRVRAGVS